MSFNKCFLNRERVLKSDITQIKYLLKRDSFLLDDWSYSFLKLLNKRIDDYQSKRSLREIDDSLLFPSNILINLINNPDDFDLTLSSSFLGVDRGQSVDFYIDKLDAYIHGHK